MLPDVLILGLAVGAAATTLTQSRIFRWLQTGAQRLHPWLGDLFNCAYCMGHWLAMLAIASWYDARNAPFYEMAVLWLAVTGVAALTSGLIGKLFSKAGNGA